MPFHSNRYYIQSRLFHQKKRADLGMQKVLLILPLHIASRLMHFYRYVIKIPTGTDLNLDCTLKV